MHKPAIKHFRKRRVIVFGINEIWGADLVDMQAFAKENDGVKYLLCVIDIFSKYAWVVPIKDKSGKSVAAAFETIFKGGRRPQKLWVDKGKEFYNKDVKLSGGRIILYRKSIKILHFREVKLHAQTERF